MSTSETITRVYREAVATYGLAGVNRLEAEESAIATLMVEVRAGRLDIDMEAALRAQLRKADESDGRSADGMLRRIAAGDQPLTLADFDVVVTLGGGLRKTWGMLDPDVDLSAMNEIRYKNYRAARDAFHEFNSNVLAVKSMCSGYGTMLDAFEDGAFGAEKKGEAA